RARLYKPGGAGLMPLVVYYHGGGHVIGDLDTHDQPCRFLAREIPAVVLAIDYRLAPEHRFPAAVDDALAAVVAQRTAAESGPAPAFQALMYPVADYSVKRRSYELFGKGFFLTREEM